MRLAVVQHALSGSAADGETRLAALVAAAKERGADLTVVPPSADHSTRQDPMAHEIAGLGGVGVLLGDDCFAPAEWERLLARGDEVVILSPGSENDLQVEAVFELALGLSDSLAGLVVVAERCGANPGEPGHGGSAIVLMGDIMAEAMDGEEILFADITVPVPQPEPRDTLPEVPVLLAQRVAHHRGLKTPVDYFADLSDTISDR